MVKFEHCQPCAVIYLDHENRRDVRSKGAVIEKYFNQLICLSSLPNGEEQFDKMYMGRIYIL